MSDKKKKILFHSCAVLFWLTVWQVAAMLIGKEILLPSPVQVCGRLFEMLDDRSFYMTCLSSSINILTGFICALALGIIIGLLMYRFSLADALFSPLIKVIRSTPVASFIILLLVWMRSSSIPTFISFLMVLPVVCANVTHGCKSINSELLEVVDVFDFSFGKKLKTLYIPSLIPFITSAAKTGIGLAWKAGVAAEVIAVAAGTIGAYLRDSKTYLETTDLFAWTVALILISAAMEYLISLVCDAVASKYSLKDGGDVL